MEKNNNFQCSIGVLKIVESSLHFYYSQVHPAKLQSISQRDSFENYQFKFSCYKLQKVNEYYSPKVIFLEFCSWKLGERIIYKWVLYITNYSTYVTDRQASLRQPARTHLQHLCADTGWSLGDLPKAMNDRDEWWGRVIVIRARGTTWWWWWWWFYRNLGGGKLEFLQKRMTGFLLIMSFDRLSPKSLSWVASNFYINSLQLTVKQRKGSDFTWNSCSGRFWLLTGILYKKSILFMVFEVTSSFPTICHQL